MKRLTQIIIASCLALIPIYLPVSATTDIRVDGGNQLPVHPTKPIEPIVLNIALLEPLEPIYVAPPVQVANATPAVTQTAPSSSMAFVFEHESGNDLFSVNTESGACGLGQALPCSKLTTVCSMSNRACQENFFAQYAQERYGGWSGAEAFWRANSWW